MVARIASLSPPSRSPLPNILGEPGVTHTFPEKWLLWDVSFNPPLLVEKQESVKDRLLADVPASYGEVDSNQISTINL